MSVFFWGGSGSESQACSSTLFASPGPAVPLSFARARSSTLFASHGQTRATVHDLYARGMDHLQLAQDSEWGDPTRVSRPPGMPLMAIHLGQCCFAAQLWALLRELGLTDMEATQISADVDAKSIASEGPESGAQAEASLG